MVSDWSECLWTWWSCLTRSKPWITRVLKKVTCVCTSVGTLWIRSPLKCSSGSDLQAAPLEGWACHHPRWGSCGWSRQGGDRRVSSRNWGLKMWSLRSLLVTQRRACRQLCEWVWIWGEMETGRELGWSRELSAHGALWPDGPAGMDDRHSREGPGWILGTGCPKCGQQDRGHPWR